MPEIFFDSTQTLPPGGKSKLRRAARRFRIWLRNLIYSMIEIVILFTATAVLMGILLSFTKALWYLYLETPVGRKYTANFSVLTTHVLSELVRRDLVLFSIEIAACALITCLMVSATIQLLAVRRYFYEGRGLVNRMVWIALFSASSAHNLTNISQIEWSIAVAISILPSLCLFASCLAIAAKLLPELTIVGIFKMTKRLINFMRDRRKKSPPPKSPTLLASRPRSMRPNRKVPQGMQRRSLSS
jgi:hypothetical protein